MIGSVFQASSPLAHQQDGGRIFVSDLPTGRVSQQVHNRSGRLQQDGIDLVPIEHSQ